MAVGKPLVPVPLARADSYASLTSELFRELILGGHYQPGDRINEVEVAASLGISRGPVREALAWLAGEGLVRQVANKGTFIPTLGADETLELYELREALEVMGARLAAERASARDLNDLRDFLDRTGAVLDSGAEEPYPQSLDFHQRILHLAGNQQILQRAREVHRQLYLVRSRSAYGAGRAREAYAEHLKVVAGIASGNPDRAETAMRNHLRCSLTHALQLFDI
jgi:DNA-binding GntR family transcriptional regulator